ncbi:MAG: carboxypeptidase regulatory-like domain-containing protein [Planctomycetes bacterium]|nr:carboxypeptidase regulatory-like domain-containing protein [Planctomycetota bacterium]
MAGRLSPLNLALLLLTVLALLFGAWGWYQAATPAAPTPANHVDDALALEPGDVDSTGKPRKTGTTDSSRPETKRETSTHKGSEPTTGAQPAPEETPVAGAPSDKGDATITGVVVNAGGGAEAGASVTCRRSDLDMTPPQMQNGDVDGYQRRVSEFLRRAAAETRRATSDSEGRFSISGLDPSLAYDLQAQSAAGGSGRLLRVAAGDSARILVAAAGMLTGKVVGPDDQPVKTFSVKSWPQNRQWEATTRPFTSEDGSFSIEASGRIQVEASADGMIMEAPAEVDVSEGGAEVTLKLQQGATLSGTVTDKAGTPLAGAAITFGAGDEGGRGGGRWTQTPRATTDSKGRFRFPALKVEETTLRATLGDMSETQTTTLVAGSNTLNFALDTGATLALRLTDPAGKPVSADAIWFQANERDWARPSKLPSREPGLVEYCGIKPGEYSLTITAAGYPAIQQKMPLNDGRNELSLKLSNGAMLSGTVTTSSGSKLQGASVRLRKDGEQGWGGWGTGRWIQLNDQGTFKLGPAEPGQWLLELYVQNRGQPLYSTTVNLAEGDNTHNMSVDTGATLVLSLVDASGNPVARANVQVRSDQVHWGSSDAKGVATIALLPAGSYTVTASGNGKASPVLSVSLANGENKYTLQMQEPNCCRVTHVYPNSQAATLGVQVGDLIFEYNGKAIKSWGEFGREARAARNAGDLSMVVDRNGSQLTFYLKGGTVGIEGADAVR